MKSETTYSTAKLYAAIMGAGFCGACLRYACQQLPLPQVKGFPLATLLVNMLGSFLIFVVFSNAGHRWHLSERTIKAVNTGFLGTFTTLSAVCSDTISLMNAGATLMAFAYVALTFALTFSAIVLAMKLCDALGAGDGV